MVRKGFIMQMLAGQAEEYCHRHQLIWPEFTRTLREHGVHSYSIFLNVKTLQLFAGAEIEKWRVVAEIAQEPICQS